MSADEDFQSKYGQGRRLVDTEGQSNRMVELRADITKLKHSVAIAKRTLPSIESQAQRNIDSGLTQLNQDLIQANAALSEIFERTASSKPNRCYSRTSLPASELSESSKQVRKRLHRGEPAYSRKDNRAYEPLSEARQKYFQINQQKHQNGAGYPAGERAQDKAASRNVADNFRGSPGGYSNEADRDLHAPDSFG